jgi:CheY-like chemotaxis protein
MNRTQRVVLIDDNEMDNEFHTWSLERAGFTGDIVAYESGAEALAGMKTLDLNLRTVVFLDINMPGMDGFAVAKALVPILENRPHVMMLMVTSSEAREDVEAAKSISSIKGYMTKPLTEEMIKKAFGAVEWDHQPVDMRGGEFWR